MKQIYQACFYAIEARLGGKFDTDSAEVLLSRREDVANRVALAVVNTLGDFLIKEVAKGRTSVIMGGQFGSEDIPPPHPEEEEVRVFRFRP